MPKTSGLAQLLLVSGFDLSGDVGSLGSVHGGPAPLDVTGINSVAHERIGGLLDGGIDYMAFFNTATGQAHPRLSLLPTTDVVLSYVTASTLGEPAAGMVAKQIDYPATRGADGSLTFTVPNVANGYSLEWGENVTAGKRTDTSGTNGASIDGGAASSTGWSAYLQVTAVAGTNVVVTLEDSANDSDWAVFTSSAFTSVTAVAGSGSQRIAGAVGSTVRRYVRAVSSGTFSSATFHVLLARHPVGATA